jgi:hypothetical protein
MVPTIRNHQDPEIATEDRVLIEGLYERSVRTLRAALDSGVPDDQLFPLIEKAKLCKEFLIVSMPPKRESRLWQSLVGLVCLALVFVLAATHLHEVAVSGKVNSSEIQLELSKPLVVNEPFFGSSILLINCDRIAGSSLDMFSHLSTITIRAQRVTLSNLRVESPGTLSVRLRGPVTVLHIDGPASGTINVQGKDASISGDVNKGIDASIPELIYFSKSGYDPGRGIDIEIRSLKKWSLVSENVSAITFWRADLSGAGTRTLRSSLESARLALPQVDSRINLHDGDEFVLGGLTLRWLRLAQINEGMELTFDGNASVAEAGMPGARNSFRPSHLAYVYAQYKASILVTSVLLLYGVIVKLVTFVRSGKQP